MRAFKRQTFESSESSRIIEAFWFSELIPREMNWCQCDETKGEIFHAIMVWRFNFEKLSDFHERKVSVWIIKVISPRITFHSAQIRISERSSFVTRQPLVLSQLSDTILFNEMKDYGNSPLRCYPLMRSNLISFISNFPATTLVRLKHLKLKLPFVSVWLRC